MCDFVDRIFFTVRFYSLLFCSSSQASKLFLDIRMCLPTCTVLKRFFLTSAYAVGGLIPRISCISGIVYVLFSTLKEGVLLVSSFSLLISFSNIFSRLLSRISIFLKPHSRNRSEHYRWCIRLFRPQKDQVSKRLHSVCF